MEIKIDFAPRLYGYLLVGHVPFKVPHFYFICFTSSAHCSSSYHSRFKANIASQHSSIHQVCLLKMTSGYYTPTCIIVVRFKLKPNYCCSLFMKCERYRRCLVGNTSKLLTVWRSLNLNHPFILQVFTGNTNALSPVTNLLDNPINARYVLFVVQSWHTHISMRVEVLGCNPGKGLLLHWVEFSSLALRLFLSNLWSDGNLRRRGIIFDDVKRVRICIFPLSHEYVVWHVLCTDLCDDARCFFFRGSCFHNFIMDVIYSEFTPTPSGIVVQVLVLMAP